MVHPALDVRETHKQEIENVHHELHQLISHYIGLHGHDPKVVYHALLIIIAQMMKMESSNETARFLTDNKRLLREYIERYSHYGT